MDSLFTLFIEPFTYGFMQRALLMSLLIATVCSIFSCFLILKGWSLMGDAVSHAVLPGLALAHIMSLPLGIGAFLAGITCALTTGFLKNNCRVKEDAIMGILFSGMFAFGLVLITQIETDIHLMHILFGNVLGISKVDLMTAGSVAALCSLIMFIKRKEFMLYCFDPAYATAIGFSVRWINITMLLLLAVTIVSSLQAAGIILVVAMLIAPGAIGFLVSKSFDRMLLIAFFASTLSCLAGTLMSFHLDVATAPLIVVIQAGLFILAYAVGKTKTSIKERSHDKIALQES